MGTHPAGCGSWAVSWEGSREELGGLSGPQKPPAGWCGHDPALLHPQDQQDEAEDPADPLGTKRGPPGPPHWAPCAAGGDSGVTPNLRTPSLSLGPPPHLLSSSCPFCPAGGHRGTLQLPPERWETEQNEQGRKGRGRRGVERRGRCQQAASSHLLPARGLGFPPPSTPALCPMGPMDALRGGGSTAAFPT